MWDANLTANERATAARSWWEAHPDPLTAEPVLVDERATPRQPVE